MVCGLGKSTDKVEPVSGSPLVETKGGKATGPTFPDLQRLGGAG